MSFRSAPISHKHAVLLIANASIPTEIGVAPDLQENQVAVWDHLWCSDFIKTLSLELDLGETNLSRYTPFALSGRTYTEMCWDDRESLMRPAIDFLLTDVPVPEDTGDTGDVGDTKDIGETRDPSASNAGASDMDTKDTINTIKTINTRDTRDISVMQDPATARLRLYTKLLIMLVHMRRLDGRGRVVMRHVLRALHLAAEQGVWVEYELGRYLAEQGEGQLKGQERKRDKYRYAKIGVAALGAGALLAFTGGLVRTVAESRE
jgi:hypothetical protein